MLSTCFRLVCDPLAHVTQDCDQVFDLLDCHANNHACLKTLYLQKYLQFKTTDVVNIQSTCSLPDGCRTDSARLDRQLTNERGR